MDLTSIVQLIAFMFMLATAFFTWRTVTKAAAIQEMQKAQAEMQEMQKALLEHIAKTYKAIHGEYKQSKTSSEQADEDQSASSKLRFALMLVDVKTAIGDLREERAIRQEENGYTSATTWYCVQIVTSVPLLLLGEASKALQRSRRANK